MSFTKGNKDLITKKEKKSRSTIRGTSRNSTNYRGATGKTSSRQKAEIIDLQPYLVIPPYEKK